MVERICTVGDDCTDRVALHRMVADLRRVSSWCQAIEVRGRACWRRCRRSRRRRSPTRPGSICGEAAKIADRAATAEALPQLGDVLADGEVTGVHVDIVGQALRELEPGLRAELAGRTAGAGRGGGVDERWRSSVVTYARWCAASQADDGMGAYEQQQRATRLRLWTDAATGMGRLSGEFDPLTFAKLERRINDTLETLFADAVPASCPSDPFAKQDHLRALALAALVNGQGRGSGRPEVTVVIDTSAVDSEGRPAVDWGIPIEVPWRVLGELVAEADVHTVVVRNGVVVHGPGRMDLGRSTRIANRAQRRVLRGLYPTCAIPGCVTRYDHCDLHHIVWWRHGGMTDLANLLPICSRHHHDIHDNDWHLSITPDRILTIVRPDGIQQTTGPPRRHAA